MFDARGSSPRGERKKKKKERMCATRDRREESRYGAWPRQRPDAL